MGTCGLAELNEDAVANSWSRNVGKFAIPFSCSPSCSSSSSSTTTIFFAGFFVLLFVLLYSLGLVFLLPGPYQLLSNTFCRTRISPLKPEIVSRACFPLA